MNKVLSPFLTALTVIVSVSPSPAKDKILSPRAKDAPVVLWSKPADISQQNLIYGQGGEQHQPHGPFTFIDEDMDGTTPKFNVRDADGTKWKAKLGIEAQPETAATRLAWAVGYFTNEDYLLPEFHVQNLPPKLKRGNNFRRPDGSFLNVRLKRSTKDMDKVASWKWMDNPFKTTRELNGLRVIQALLNNWDLKTENNGVFEGTLQGRPARVYMVTDWGASFGGTGLGASRANSKGNLKTFEHSKFITKTTPAHVSFATPSRPSLLRIFIPTEYFSRLGLEKIGRNIPRDHARWIGQQLAQLTPAQIRDAFRAANYSSSEVEAFASIVQTRIQELNKL